MLANLDLFWPRICLLWNQCYSTIGVLDWIFSFWIWNNDRNNGTWNRSHTFNFVSEKRTLATLETRTPKKQLPKNWVKLSPKIAVNCRRRVHNVFLPEHTHWIWCVSRLFMNSHYLWHIRTARIQPNRTDDWTPMWECADCWEKQQHRKSRMPKKKNCATQTETEYSGDTNFGEDRKVNSIAENVNEVNATHSEHCCLSSSTHLHPASIFYAFSFGWAATQPKMNVHRTRSTAREVCARVRVRSIVEKRRSAVCLDKKQCLNSYHVCGTGHTTASTTKMYF